MPMSGYAGVDMQQAEDQDARKGLDRLAADEVMMQIEDVVCRRHSALAALLNSALLWSFLRPGCH